MSDIKDIKSILSSLPDKPGVTSLLTHTVRIIYIGKAKNLKKRIASYFAKNQSGKDNDDAQKGGRISSP